MEDSLRRRRRGGPEGRRGTERLLLKTRGKQPIMGVRKLEVPDSLSEARSGEERAILPPADCRPRAVRHVAPAEMRAEVPEP